MCRWTEDWRNDTGSQHRARGTPSASGGETPGSCLRTTELSQLRGIQGWQGNPCQKEALTAQIIPHRLTSLRPSLSFTDTRSSSITSSAEPICSASQGSSYLFPSPWPLLSSGLLCLQAPLTDFTVSNLHLPGAFSPKQSEWSLLYRLTGWNLSAILQCQILLNG